MISLQEIRELKEYLVNDYHSNRVNEQTIDEDSCNDTFPVKFIKKEVQEYIVRTGKGPRMVDGPAEHILTNNPQVFRDATNRKTGRTSAEADARVGSELNRWAEALLRQNPQPYKEFVKNILRRGEAYVHISYDNDTDVPFRFAIPDPIIVFPYGWEEDGVPKQIIISYDRIAAEVKSNYGSWEWQPPEGKTIYSKVPHFMYWDKDVRYFEAGGYGLLKDIEGNLSNGSGIQENVNGFVPFVHAYSGFGKGSADGDPAGLAMGRLRKVRDLLGEQCAIKSVINYLIFQYAHSPIIYEYDPSIGLQPPDITKTLDMSPGSAITIPVTPGSKGLRRMVEMGPSPELYQHYYDIEREIDQEDPLGIIPQGIGTSGRQQDMATVSALSRYATVVDNTAHAFETVFGMGLRIIEKLPMYRPEGIKEGDIGGDYTCRIELKADDPIERDRLATLGSRLYQMGEIDLETNLIKYQGFTQEQAQEIMAKILADNATRNNPVIAQIMGETAAQEIGMEEQYNALKQANQQLKENSLPGIPQIGSQGGPPREGNIQSLVGQEMVDMALAQRGQRKAPVR